MASRLSRRAFAQLARPSARVAGRNAGRRTMSSGAHEQSSDKPWIIGSALVFGPVIAYLLSPSATKQAHHAQEHSLPKKKESNPDNAPVPSTPPPQETAPKEEPTKKAEGSVITDDEGATASTEEVTDSINKAVDEDSPKDAQAAESAEAKGQNKSDGASSGDKAIQEKSEPVGEHEQKEKPAQPEGGKSGGKLESKTDDSPANMGEARGHAKQGEDPKDVEKNA